MKSFLFTALLLVAFTARSQELFVFTEPASNMAAKSIGLRLNNYLMGVSNSSRLEYHLIPEVMLGVSKNMMVHADAFFSNRTKSFRAEGGSVYVKYRFYNNDDVQRHFRMAFFARGSLNNSEIDQEQINLYSHNTGYEAGIVATQLLHKVALSSAASFVRALDNTDHPFLYGKKNSKALNYTLSFGKLMLPRHYNDYRQTNLNLMLEFLTQYNWGSGRYYIDAAPAVQLIVNSRSRIDLAYRKQLGASLLRTAPNGFFVRLEYNLFNAYK
jgi:hypothetical protein